MRQFLLLPTLLMFLLVNSVQGQLLLKNIDGGTGNSDPNGFIEMGELVFFEATTTANGKELWRSDGTEAGTFMVKDINAGSANSNIDELTVMDGKLYFVAYDGGAVSGRELWVTDGTTVGTTVIDIVSGTGSSNPDELVVMNNMLYFAATNGTTGEELWVSDGTIGNTSQLKDINPSAPGSSNPAELTYYNNAIYFRANDGTTGSEIWKSDGTAVGTVLLSDINSSTGSSPGDFCIANGLLFFTANGPGGQELYYTNGTGANLIEINPTGDANPSEMIEHDGKLYFSASDDSGVKKLWTTDGGAAVVHPTDVTNPTDLFGWNTKLFLAENGDMRIITGSTIEAVNGFDAPSAFTLYNNRVFFVADDGGTHKIWMTDGTVAGTQLAMDVDVMPILGKYEMEVAGNHLYFALNDAATGSEVNFIGDCDPNRPGTTMTMVKETNKTHHSIFETTDANNWTHYCDCTNKILLSINKTGTGAVIPSDGVSVEMDITLATTYDTGGGVGEACGSCFITSEWAGVVFNRSWDVQPTTQPTSNVPVRFYFSKQDYDAVNIDLGFFGTPMVDPDEMSFFKVTNGGLGQHPEIPNIEEGDAIVLTHGTTAELNTWKKGLFSTDDFYSEFLVSSFSGGGGGTGTGSGGTEALPVELIYFRGEPVLPKNHVALEWATASELNNYGFFIERSFDSRNWQIVGFVKGTEEEVFPAVYNFVDKNPEAGDNYYRLRQRDFDGKEEISSVVHVSMDLFIVGNIFPNPVTINSEVLIDITTPVSSDATVEVYDLNRQLLIVNQHELPAGPQLVPLDLNGLPGGMYIVKVESQGVVVNTRMLVQE